MVFNTIELAFELPRLGAVSVHLLAGAIPILIEIIDHECGVVVHLEAFDAELDSYKETMKCHLIFSGIIGCLEVLAEDIVKLIPRW